MTIESRLKCLERRARERREALLENENRTVEWFWVTDEGEFRMGDGGEREGISADPTRLMGIKVVERVPIDAGEQL